MQTHKHTIKSLLHTQTRVHTHTQAHRQAHTHAYARTRPQAHAQPTITQTQPDTRTHTHIRWICPVLDIDLFFAMFEKPISALSAAFSRQADNHPVPVAAPDFGVQAAFTAFSSGSEWRRLAECCPWGFAKHRAWASGFPRDFQDGTGLLCVETSRLLEVLDGFSPVGQQSLAES